MNDVKFRAKPKKSKSKTSKSKKDIWKPTGKVFTKMGYIWRPTGRTFTIVGKVCPLTRITTTNEVPSRKPIALESKSPKLMINLVYSRKPRKSKNTESVSRTEVIKTTSANKQEPSKSRGSTKTNVPSTSLNEYRLSKSSSVKFGNDQVAKIMGYGDYQIGNVTISRVYYVEGLGHNLFSVGQFCDSNLEVAFRQHTCFIRNLEGVDLLTGSRGDNLYTLSLGNMMASSPICLLSKASKTKSWLWHRLQLKETVRRIRTDNGTEFANQTLREYYEKVGISHENPLHALHSKTVLLKDEILAAMASEHNSSGPALHEMTPVSIRELRQLVETIHVDFDDADRNVLNTAVQGTRIFMK
ncbi:integrase, catalytic region, zinc finger, CCHC-type containing protein [Tanacetum coccineum]